MVVHRLSCFTACGIFLDQGFNPCSLYWQTDYSPLHHQGSPRSNICNIGTDGRHAQRDPYGKTQQETIRTVIAPFSTRLWNGHWQWEMVTEKNWLYVGSVSLTLTFAFQLLLLLSSHYQPLLHNGWPQGTQLVCLNAHLKCLCSAHGETIWPCPPVDGCRKEEINTSPTQAGPGWKYFAKIMAILLYFLTSSPSLF